MFFVQYSTMQYIQLTDAEDSETIEVPCEDDGTLTVSSLAAHYPGATGLKYRINGHVRAVKLSNGKLYPPEGGWKDLTYYCIFPKGISEELSSIWCRYVNFWSYFTHEFFFVSVQKLLNVRLMMLSKRLNRNPLKLTPTQNGFIQTWSC